MGFDAAGLLCGLGMVLSVARYHGLFSGKLTNYIVLGWQPHRSNKTVIAKTAFGNTLFAPALHREYALKFRGGAYHLDQEGLLAALVRYAKQGRPVRLVGFPAYTHFLLKEMERRGISLRLAPGSMILLGGGWKQFYREAVDKEVLYGEARDRLGIPETHIREFFGAVEHPISYCDCRFHHFHVPVYSRVLIRDVDTLEPLPHGPGGAIEPAHAHGPRRAPPLGDDGRPGGAPPRGELSPAASGPPGWRSSAGWAWWTSRPAPPAPRTSEGRNSHDPPSKPHRQARRSARGPLARLVCNGNAAQSLAGQGVRGAKRGLLCPRGTKVTAYAA